MAEIQVRVWRVARDSQLNSMYLLVLRDGSERVLCIRVGPCEFSGLVEPLSRSQPDGLPWRPRTHDLICSLIEKMGARITKVVIDDLWNEVFFAKLHLRLDGRTIAVDARPSDAIALALRAGSPLFCEGSVLAAAGESASSYREGPDDFPAADNLD